LGEETASQKIEHLGLMFGALAASPTGPVKGRGIPLSQLTFGLLIFPGVWTGICNGGSSDVASTPSGKKTC